MTQRFAFVTGLLAASLLEEGAFCHFTDPNTGDPLYLPGAKQPDGSMDETKRVGAYVRSTSSKVYEDHVDRVTRRAVAGNRKAKTEAAKQEMVISQLKSERPETFSVVVSRFLNTSPTEAGEWEPTHEEKLEIAKDPHNRFIVDQVIAFSEEASNYGAEAGNAVAA